MTSKAFELAQLGDAVTVDSSKVGIGTSSPDALTHIYSGASGVTNPHSYTKLHVESADHNAIQLSGSSGGEQWIWFADDTSATPVGGITYYHGENYMAFRTNGGEKLRIDSTGTLNGPSSANFDIKTGSGTGDMRFFTQGVQRAMVGADANLFVGTTSTSPNPGVVLQPIGNIGIGNSNANSGASFLEFRRNATQIGGVTQSGTTGVSYNTSSDYRLKENVTDVTDGITRVKQLAPKRFNFIADPETIVDGFLAHEAQAVVPESVTGTHNEVDNDGNAVMQGIDQSKLVPLLTAALQEAITKIENLETENAAIKTRLDALEAE